MIQKDYFPTQETPAWVKDKIMQQISARPKKLRLVSVLQYRILASVVLLVGLVIGGYSYLHVGKTSLLVSTTSGTQTLVHTGSVFVTTTPVPEQGTTTDVDALLQQKLAEAEATLNALSTSSIQETNITL
ncbi:MAG: hypothetical protein NTX91_01555 [candidate division SR1 bacterium]|nr:hypothetical protein [candidate division SR1 bacterium]